jgi:prepilin-type processing-associated H-X9-DG protein
VELLTVIAIVAVLAALLMPIAKRSINGGKDAVSMNNLRSLQAANVLYASDHDGNYVPPVTLKPNTSQVNWDTGPWLVNPEFTPYLNVPYANWDDHKAPATTSGHKITLNGSPGKLTIAMNVSRFPNGGFFWNGRGQLKTTQILAPAKTMIFAEAVDWMVDYPHRNNWTNDLTTAGMAIAFRNAGKTCAMVFFDGHVELVTKERSQSDRSLWFYDE